MQRIEINDTLLMTIIGFNLIMNIIFLNRIHPKIPELIISGYILLGVGAVLIAISTYTLITKGVNSIIDTGIYGIIRHPMYLGGIIMFFSHLLLGQNWIVAMNTFVAICCCYLIILSGDKRNIKKYGDKYRQYMISVPRINFILGMIRKRRF